MSRAALGWELDSSQGCGYPQDDPATNLVRYSHRLSVPGRARFSISILSVLCLHAIYSISLLLFESIKSLYLPRGLPATEASPSGLGLGRCGWRPTPNASPNAYPSPYP